MQAVCMLCSKSSEHLLFSIGLNHDGTEPYVAHDQLAYVDL